MTTLPLSIIDRDPSQPRERFALGPLQELADSIASVGLLSPIIVRPDGLQYRIVAGERRWRAAAMAGLSEVPVIVRDDLDERSTFELQMIENVIRSDMDAMEEARGYQRLVAMGLAVEAIAARIGKSPAAIKARLDLLRLNETAADMVAKGHLDAWTAQHMSRLSSESQHKVLRAMREGMLPAGDKNAIDRLCTALAEQDAKVAAMGDDLFVGECAYTSPFEVPVVDEARRRGRALDDEIASVLDRLARIVELLEDAEATDPADAADKLKALSARAVKSLHTAAVAKVARRL